MAFDFSKMATTVTSKVTKLGQEATAMTKNVTENVRLSGAISEQKKIIEEMYSAIGKKYYEQYEKNPEAEYKLEITNITTALNKIAELERELSEVKGNCPSCGAKLTPGVVFCVNCGAKIAKDEEIQPQNTSENTGSQEAHTEVVQSAEVTGKVCPNCNKAVENESAFCIYCGSKLS